MLRNTPPSAVLIARRKAAAVLNMLCIETLQMGTMAERFNGDADDDWACIDESAVRAIRNQQLVALVELSGETARVEIPNARRLANRKHANDFNPAEVGFGPQALNWRQDREPYVFTVPIPESIPGLHAPQKPVPREMLAGKINVRRML